MTSAPREPSVRHLKDLCGPKPSPEPVGRLPETRGEKGVAKPDSDATRRDPYATRARAVGEGNHPKSLKENGEPPGTRTPNPQIKSLLLCQLS